MLSYLLGVPVGFLRIEAMYANILENGLVTYEYGWDIIAYEQNLYIYIYIYTGLRESVCVVVGILRNK